MLKGIIFDVDGVLVDSEPYIAEAAIRMFAEHGVTVNPEDFIPFVGTGENRFIGGVADKYGLVVNIEEVKAETYRLYDELVKGRLGPVPGVGEFIASAKARGLKLAVASSADRIKIDINLRQAGLSEEVFDAIVSGLDVVNKKPNPEIFLKAAAKIGLLPDECLVVEDAINGVDAAKAGGFKCFAVTTSFTPELLKDADWVSSDFTDVPEEALNW